MILNHRVLGKKICESRWQGVAGTKATLIILSVCMRGLGRHQYPASLRRMWQTNGGRLVHHSPETISGLTADSCCGSGRSRRPEYCPQVHGRPATPRVHDCPATPSYSTALPPHVHGYPATPSYRTALPHQVYGRPAAPGKVRYRLWTVGSAGQFSPHN